MVGVILKYWKIVGAEVRGQNSAFTW